MACNGAAQQHLALLLATMALSVANMVLYFLEPMLLEPGLGKSHHQRDRLALDEPKVLLTWPT